MWYLILHEQIQWWLWWWRSYNTLNRYDNAKLVIITRSAVVDFAVPDAALTYNVPRLGRWAASYHCFIASPRHVGTARNHGINTSNHYTAHTHTHTCSRSYKVRRKTAVRTTSSDTAEITRDAFVRTSCRAIAMMLVRLSVCLGRACIVIIRCTLARI